MSAENQNIADQLAIVAGGLADIGAALREIADVMRQVHGVPHSNVQPAYTEYKPAEDE